MSRGTLHRFCAVRNNLVNVNDEDRGSLRELARYLVGPAEISALLNVEANTVNVWKVRHAEFPKPVKRLRSGDLWDVREIAAWAAATGRPASKSLEHHAVRGAPSQ